MKNQITYSFLLLLMIGFFFTDCSIQKRKYRSGFYVSTSKKHLPKSNTTAPKSAQVFNNSTQQYAQREDAKISVKQELGLTASAENAGREHKQKFSVRPLPLVEDSCGDRIMLLNGEEISCKLYEINTNNIVYKPCDNLDGPMIIKSKDKVFLIKYLNGSKEVFKHEKTLSPQKLYATPTVSDKKKLSGLSLAAFILSLFSWTIILAPIALVMGIIGKNEIKRDPDKFKGDGFATAAIILSSFVLFLLLLVIISAIFL